MVGDGEDKEDDVGQEREELVKEREKKRGSFPSQTDVFHSWLKDRRFVSEIDGINSNDDERAGSSDSRGWHRLGGDTRHQTFLALKYFFMENIVARFAFEVLSLWWGDAKKKKNKYIYYMHK